MKFRTEIEKFELKSKIDYGTKIFAVGSCFAQNIAQRMLCAKFRVTTNPTGILFNPASIAQAITDTRYPISDTRFLHHNGLWHSMMHHGSFSCADQQELVRRCEESRLALQSAVAEATTVIITFGTAWVYQMDGEVVANCHKLPANRFVRRRLTVDEIVDMWQPIVASMPDKHWIFTVSPIRHAKDGLHENQISKAILLQAVDILTAQRSNSPTGGLTSDSAQRGLSYFPSYEIMMDELRDYRFYAEDMCHPTLQAVNYIRERFLGWALPSDELQILEENIKAFKRFTHISSK